MATKAELRAAYLARRQALTEAEWAARSFQVAQHLFDQVTFTPEDTVHVFIPIARKRELDTWPIIRGLWERGCTVVVPVSNMATKTMEQARLLPDTPLAEVGYGMQEPADPEFMAAEQITHVLVPLLVVDRQGHRIGYGGGFYDRFFERISPQVKRIGLSLESPVDDIPEVHEQDVPLQGCITPKGYVAF